MRGRFGWGAAIAAAVVSVTAASAAASTFEVTRTSDPPPGSCKPRDCSLREAVGAANAQPGVDRVLLPRATRYELTRTAPGYEDANLSGDLDINNDPLSIVHPGRGRATIDANDLDRVLHGQVGAAITIRRLSLVGGRSGDADGGAILADAAVAVIGSRITGNESVGNDAGAVKASGPLTIANSTIGHNRADGGGGAIFAVTDDVTIRNSTLVANSAANNGGAIVAGGSGQAVAIQRSTVANNRTTSASGGGLYGLGPAEITIKSSTVSGNRALGSSSDGGGLYFDGPLATVVNSTIAGNRANGTGGGIHARDATDLSLNAVTVARNVADADQSGLAPLAGGGLYRLSSAGFDVRNSLIALNGQGPSAFGQDCAGDSPIDSLGSNLLSTTNGGGCQGFDEPTDLIRANPRIGELAANGGPTKTVALKAGSPAVGRAHKPSCPARDQRGRKRGNDPDIGAYERGA